MHTREDILLNEKKKKNGGSIKRIATVTVITTMQKRRLLKALTPNEKYVFGISFHFISVTVLFHFY